MPIAACLVATAAAAAALPGELSPAASVAASTAAPAPPRYLIVHSMGYGRYSNNRASLVEALGLANFTGRTLVAPPLTGCPGGQLHALFDVGAAGIIERATLPDLRGLCGDNGTAVLQLPHGKEFQRDGVWWRNVRPMTEYPLTARGVPPELRRFVSRSPVAAPPYVPFFPREYRNDVQLFLLDALLPLRLQREPARCLLLPSLYLTMNWALMGPSFARATAALRPSPALDALVTEWFSAHAVPPHGALGVHLRISGMATRRTGFKHDCEARPQFVVRNVSRLRAAVTPPPPPRPGGRGGAAPVLVASDSFHSKCARAVIAAFPRAVRVVPPFPAAHCGAAAFVHEVLGKTAAFVGNGESSFSAAVHAIRTLRHGHDPATSSFPSLTEAEKRPARTNLVCPAPETCEIEGRHKPVRVI